MELGLSNNQIADVAPLSALKKLTTLYLSSNQIVDVAPLQALLNLTTLDLRYNQITEDTRAVLQKYGIKPTATSVDLSRLYTSVVRTRRPRNGCWKSLLYLILPNTCKKE